MIFGSIISVLSWLLIAVFVLLLPILLSVSTSMHAELQGRFSSRLNRLFIGWWCYSAIQLLVVGWLLINQIACPTPLLVLYGLTGAVSISVSWGIVNLTKEDFPIRR